MPTLSPWDADAFTMRSLTQAINILPNLYGRTNELNLFPVKGVTTRSIMLEEQNGVLNLLETRPVGAPGQENKMGKRKVRSFTVPHIPLEDTILPDEYDGIRAFGTENQVSTLAQIMNNHLQTGLNKFAITLEHLRMGALKGQILDSDASTIYNLFTEFSISEKEVDFVLGTSTTNIQDKCFEVSRHIEDNLKGEVMTKVHCLVDATFFSKLIAHSKVREAYLYHASAQQMLGGDPRKGFTFTGITFEEYRGTATDSAGNARVFLASGTGRAFPLGTMNTFSTIYAPGTFLETVNTIGIPYYAKQEARKYNRGVDIWMESNPLPMCNRPALLVKVKSSN